jgi:hypothetical protein
MLFWLLATPLVYAQSPARCDTVYAVHDENARHSQFFTYDINQAVFEPLGELHRGKDIEALVGHPETHLLYATSGKKRAELFNVDGETGELSLIGDIGFDNVVGLAFHPDNTLWGWSDQGLIKINLHTGEGELVPNSVSVHRVYSLTWDLAGTTLYATADDTDYASTLWAYNGTDWNIACEGLPKKVEGLETLPDGNLIYGFHQDMLVGIHFYDVDNCQTVGDGYLETNYNDIEGIAWPTHSCITTSPANIEALNSYLKSLENVESVHIRGDGAIEVTMNGEIHQSQLVEPVTPGTPPADGQLVMIAIDDRNGDGIDDISITYPNGDQQLVYYLGVIQQPSAQLQITTPTQNENVRDNRILVEGTYEGPSNTGITVNGITALISKGRFIANNVPLEVGKNTLTATLTTFNGETTTHHIDITSQGTSPSLVVNASPATGLAPLSVTFEYNFNTDTWLSSLYMDFEGDGTNDFYTRSSLTTIQHDYNTPGIYVAKMQITDNKGYVYRANTTVEVVSAEQMDNLFRHLWDEMNEALVAEEIDTALRYLNTAAQAKYAPVFEVLLPHMPEIVASYSPLKRVSISENMGEYAVTRTINGEMKIFFIYYLRGADGVWRLDSM